ncbi:MAG: TonB-dependent receptor [Cyclobacteriaceae bacterium]|nr:TonB-dependent receptor [Cyclobacteriaceae bacterium]
MSRRNINVCNLFKIWFLLLVAGSGHTYAQEKITHLDEVEIVAGELSRFGAGAFISEVDSSVIKNYGRQSLAELLVNNTSANIKQYGSGQLASISFRGTGAGHTSVRWNGLQVGYPFLGQADFSVIPLEFIDEVSLLHGSASARYGTGAIGGLVDLQSGEPLGGLNIMLHQSVGSFGSSNSALQFSEAKGNGYVRIGGFYNHSNNNFKVRSSNGDYLGRQENANYFLSGGILEAGYQLGNAGTLEIKMQQASTNRNLQPSIGSNSLVTNQRDENLWASVAFERDHAASNLKLQYGYLFDRINFEGSVTDSRQNIFQGSYDFDVSHMLSLEVGSNATWVNVLTPNYDNGEAQETRMGIFVSAQLQPTNKLEASINLRQSFATGYSVPFTPSLGLSYLLNRSENWRFKLRGQVSKGYRVPTLNDRFWVPGGNPDLEPEESVNAELGFDLTQGKAFWVHMTTYKMWVTNWILWEDQGVFWSPENAQKVEGDGIELDIGYHQAFGKVHAKYWLNYAYTKSTNMEARNVYDHTVGKQLAYVPFHNANAHTQWSLNEWSALLTAQFTGKRYTSNDNDNSVPEYLLINLRASRSWVWNTWTLNAFLEANNLTNTNYQSVLNRAMPGINFSAGIRINFNKPNNELN